MGSVSFCAFKMNLNNRQINTTTFRVRCINHIYATILQQPLTRYRCRVNAQTRLHHHHQRQKSRRSEKRKKGMKARVLAYIRVQCLQCWPLMGGKQTKVKSIKYSMHQAAPPCGRQKSFRSAANGKTFVAIWAFCSTWGLAISVFMQKFRIPE